MTVALPARKEIDRRSQTAAIENLVARRAHHLRMVNPVARVSTMRFGKFLVLILLLLTSVYAIGSAASSIHHRLQRSRSFDRLVEQAKADDWKSLPIGERTAAVGRALVGTRYKSFTLEIDNRSKQLRSISTAWIAGPFLKSRWASPACSTNRPKNGRPKIAAFHRARSLSRR